MNPRAMLVALAICGISVNARPQDAPSHGPDGYDGKVDHAPAASGTIDRARRSNVTNRLYENCFIGDGRSHQLSTVTRCNGEDTTGLTLARWQARFPHVTSSSDEVDWVAIQATLDATEGPVADLRVPPGSVAVLNKPLALPPSKHVSISGAGRNASILRWTAPVPAGIYGSSANEAYWLHVRDIALQTSVDQPTGVAIKWSVSGLRVGYAVPIDIRDVFIGADSFAAPYSHYWSTGIETTCANFGIIDNAIIYGKSTAPAGSGNMTYGINAHRTCSGAAFDGFKILHSHIWKSQYGIKFAGDAEAARVDKTEIVDVSYGVIHTDSPGDATINVTNSHISSLVAGITLTGGVGGIVSDNTLFTTGAAGVAAVDLQSKASGINIHNNNIVSYSSGSSYTGVKVSESSTRNKIMGNTCINAGKARMYCVDTQGAGKGVAANIISDNSVSGSNAAFERNPSLNAVYANNTGLSAEEQDPQWQQNSTSPSISFPSSLVRTNSTVPTNVVKFANASIPQSHPIIVRCADTNTTFVHGSFIHTLTGANVTCTLGKTLGFMFTQNVAIQVF